MDREQRIKELAYLWYEYHKAQGHAPDQLRDWLISERIIDAQDKAPLMEYKWKNRPSRMK